MTAPEENEVALSGGNYDLLRRRLVDQVEKMRAAAAEVDAARVAAFGTIELRLIGSSRLATAVACQPRDIDRVGELLVFGFNTALELADVTPEHVFGLYSVGQTAAGEAPEVHPLAPDDPRNFLADPGFREDFAKLYRFYGKARFIDFRRQRDQFLAVFAVGESADDVQALRWTVRSDGQLVYVDARGGRDYTFPAAHELVWTTSSREDQRAGAYPVVSVLDEVFVGFRDGRLQLRVDAGAGASRAEIDETVENPNQSLTDVTVRHAHVGDTLVITVSVYAEDDRTYVFSRSSRTGLRVDAAGESSRILPGGDGIIFCGGYHLPSSGTRTFDVDTDDMVLESVTASPNGEDHLFVYHRRTDGAYLLMPYNLVRREVSQAITCHGLAIFDDGSMVLFRAAPQDTEPTVTHPIQWWQSPFATPDAPVVPINGDEWMGRVGNADLVSGIGAVYELARTVDHPDPNRRRWENAARLARRTLDANLWLADPQAHGMRGAVNEVAGTISSLIDEYADRERRRADAARALTEVQAKARDAMARISGANDPAAVVATLGELRRVRAAVSEVADLDQVDTTAIEALIGDIDDANNALSEHAVSVLDDATAFASISESIAGHRRAVDTAATAADLAPVIAALDTDAEDLDAVVDTVAALDAGDPTVRTRIVRSISDVTGELNRARNALEAKRRELTTTETSAAFDAEIALIEQTVGGSVAAAATPEACDAVLARLLVSVERLESRYGDDPDREASLAELRTGVHEAVSARRSSLVEERNRRTERVMAAGIRLCETIARRASELATDAEVDALFAADRMASRVRELAGELETLGDGGRAAELRSKLTGSAEEARRRLRDKVALGGDDRSVVLGRHRLVKNTEPFEVLLSGTGDGRVVVTVTGTDYRADVTDRLSDFTDLLQLTFPSENDKVSRSEYLAWVVVADAAEHGGIGALVADAARPEVLAERITRLSEQRHADGYQRGVHDHDAARIIAALSAQLGAEPLLRYPSRVRGLARLWWSTLSPERRRPLVAAVAVATATRADVGATGPTRRAAGEIAFAVSSFLATLAATDPTFENTALAVQIATYVVDELATGEEFTVTETAQRLRTSITETLGVDRVTAFVAGLAGLDAPTDRFVAALDWVNGFVGAEASRTPFTLDTDDVAADLAIEAAGASISTRLVVGGAAVTVTGLAAAHPRLADGKLVTRIDALAGSAGRHVELMSRAWPAFVQARSEVLAEAAAALHLDEHRPRVMSGFVRNRLIDSELLPMFGGNLARQLGTADGTDTARQGLLVVVSPPGYGKTTLVEWLAERMGLLLVKVNGPALGQETVSLDPADAPNATARAEIEKINLAFRLGRNVMLYLDDIQHTSPTLLSRFIPLADATRRIEGVLDGQAHTFDLRGKRFAVVMAGNPYTTGGGRFELPDMLVNRSDVHNLGDVSSGAAAAFASSYLENSVTANPTLAPHAARLLDDLTAVTAMAVGRAPIDAGSLKHRWETADLTATAATVGHLARARDVLLKVNEQYIASASAADSDRPTPPFLLQGSYRNMARIASRIVPVMTEAEVDALVREHYEAEAQTLTDAAESNLLAFVNLIGVATDAEQARWAEVIEAHRRRQDAADPAAAVVRAIDGLALVVRGSSG